MSRSASRSEVCIARARSALRSRVATFPASGPHGAPPQDNPTRHRATATQFGAVIVWATGVMP